MRRWIPLLATLLVATLTLPAQSNGLDIIWHKVYGGTPTGQGANSILELPGGDFLSTGSEVTYYNNLSDVSLLRMTPDGVVLWREVEGVLPFDSVAGLSFTAEGDIRMLVSIQDRSTTPWSGLYQFTYSLDGILLDEGFVGDWPLDVHARDHKGIGAGESVAAGWAERTPEPADAWGIGPTDAWLVKLGSDGQPLWDATFDFSEYDRAFSVLPLDDGGYLVCGGTDYPIAPPPLGGNYGTNDGKAFLVRTDASGTELWRRTYDHEGFLDVCYDVRPAIGGYILSGSWSLPTYKGTRSLLIRVDEEGNELWNLAYPYAYKGIAAYGAIETEDGGFLHAGWDTAYETNNRPGGYVAKVNAFGEPLWHQSLNPDTVDGFWGGYLYTTVFEEVSSGGYLLGGAVIRYEPDGLFFRLGPDTGQGEPPPPPPPLPEKQLIELWMKAEDVAGPLNRKSSGVTPVTVLTTENFDPTTLDLATVELSGATTILKKKDRYKCSWEDVDNDGDLDLKLFFPNQQIKLTLADDSLTLTGQTLEGKPVVGYAPIWCVH